jgi:hypothetical protein
MKAQMHELYEKIDQIKDPQKQKSF